MKITRTLALLLATTFFLWGCDVEQTDEGSLPDVDVEGGDLPEYDVDAPDVDIDMEKETVTVPDIDVEPADEGETDDPGSA